VSLGFQPPYPNEKWGGVTTTYHDTTVHFPSSYINGTSLPFSFPRRFILTFSGSLITESLPKLELAVDFELKVVAGLTQKLPLSCEESNEVRQDELSDMEVPVDSVTDSSLRLGNERS